MTVATTSGFGQKPRPACVIQATSYLGLSTVVLALISSDTDAARVSVNVDIAPSEDNGLRLPSWIMVHSLATARTDEIGKVIGALSAADLARVNVALMVFLGLGQS